MDEETKAKLPKEEFIGPPQVIRVPSMGDRAWNGEPFLDWLTLEHEYFVYNY